MGIAVQDNDVGAKVEGALAVRGGERVVDDNVKLSIIGTTLVYLIHDFADGANIDHFQSRVDG